MKRIQQVFSNYMNPKQYTFYNQKYICKHIDLSICISEFQLM